MMEHCPQCSQPLVPFRGKQVCRTPGCGYMESCCDGGWMSRDTSPAKDHCTTTGGEPRRSDSSADAPGPRLHW